MIYSAVTIPVSPDGDTPLSREQVWKGSELKARDARLFLLPGLCPADARGKRDAFRA